MRVPERSPTPRARPGPTGRVLARLASQDLPEGAMRRLEHPPYHVLVARVGGEAYAIEDACCHAGASLARGELEGPCVVCPAHAYRFDVRSGELVEPAGLCESQRRFRVHEEEGELLVIDDAEGA